jgi:hypothetical protein
MLETRVVRPVAVSYRVSARRGTSRSGKLNHFKCSALVKRREDKTILKESFYCFKCLRIDLYNHISDNNHFLLISAFI